MFTEGTTYINTNSESHKKWCNIPLLDIEIPVFNYGMATDDQQLQRSESINDY